ncbi:MAG: DNA-processing protein DprA [Desulfovibrionaceae bacterium]
MTEHDQKEFWASLALRHAKGLGPSGWKRLLDHYGSAQAAVSDVRAWAAKELAPQTRADAFRTESWRDPAGKEWSLAKACGYGVLLWRDPAYPDLLRRIPDPPLFLYVHGDVTLLKNPGVAIVGSRKCSGRGREITRTLAADLARAGVTVVSGMAWGIDRQAHLAALDEVGSSIAVLGTGLDLIYPGDNRDVWMRLAQRGLLVSELSPGVRPEPFNFPRRNRIISGLSLGVVVAEAPVKSGALNTVQHALVQNREVFAVPGPEHMPSFSGCHRLMEEGAKPITCAEDVLRELAPLLRPVERGAAPERRREPREENGDGADAPVAPPRAAAVAKGADEVAAPAAPTPTPPPVKVRRARRIRPDAASPGASVPPPVAAADACGQDAAEIEARAMLDVLDQDHGMHVDALGNALGWDAGRVSRVLLVLEVQGRVSRMPGMRYAKSGG